MRRQIVPSDIGPERVRRVGPRTIFVNSLPHFIKRRIVSVARLKIDEDMPVASRITRTFHGRIRRNGSGGEVRLIESRGDRDVGLVVRNFDRRDAIGKWAVISEERLDRRGLIAAVNGCRGRIVDWQTGGRRVDAMVKDGCRRKDVGEKFVVTVDSECDLLRRLRAGRVGDDELRPIGALAADEDDPPLPVADELEGGDWRLPQDNDLRDLLSKMDDSKPKNQPKKR